MGEKILIAVISAIIGAVITGVVTTILHSQPEVVAYDAQTFFHYYYGAVTQENQRRALYNTYLSPDFRRAPGHDWHSYETFWDGEKYVAVERVSSLPDNPWAFRVTLVYFSKNGSVSAPQDTIFSLICTGSDAWFYTRIPSFGCPWKNIQIESGYVISGSSP
jgi:hypothetical protein